MITTPDKTYDRAVFCDFDGTITNEDNFVRMIRAFTPEAATEALRGLRQGEITLRQAIRTTLESIESSRLDDIVAYAQKATLRKGFPEFCGFLEAHNVPLVIITGGLVAMVRETLKEYMHRVHALYGVHVETGGKTLAARSDLEGGTELVAKAKIMERFAPKESVALGDTMTDHEIALKADVVFARSYLAAFLEERGKPFIFFETFFDVIKHLEPLWSEKT